MARLIKKGATEQAPMDSEVSSPNRKIISADKHKAKSEARDIRQGAQEKADHIVRQAQAEADKIRKTAYEEAKQQGYAEGKSEGAGELATFLAENSNRARQIEAQVVPQLKELAVQIARKILGRELEFHPDGVIDIVKQALTEKARLRREIFLRVHPLDLETIRAARPQLLEVLSRCKDISLREDDNVSRHGVIIETDAGTIDAQLETQLAVFERVLKATD